MSTQIKKIEEALTPLLAQLNSHKLYSAMTNIKDVTCFMEQHVFAVWDFMSLLKALQNKLTCTALLWMPAKNPATARFINEIVLGEESDLNELGQPKSHYEMYLDAMTQVGANTETMQQFVSQLAAGKSLHSLLPTLPIQPETAQFVAFTFDVINTNEAHKIAAAFTFGREDIIPDMFFQIIKQSEKEQALSFSKLTYYLQRHIELDGDEHGPLSLKMIEELCGNDTQKWKEVLEISKTAIIKRISLWDGIVNAITQNKQLVSQ
ncbi:DUF3050 domain-containing protein [Bizionia sediminis]|uniref:DUF3050 domain-containing protein n=1 Tax=Bizionia sediminis TaxID=1737064 RepID=A0ABW5KSA6_9FLAO